MGKQKGLDIHVESMPNGRRVLVNEDGDILVSNLNSLSAADANSPELIGYQIENGIAYTGAIKHFDGLPYVFVSLETLAQDPSFVEQEITINMQRYAYPGLWISLMSPQMGMETHPLVLMTQARAYFDKENKNGFAQPALSGFNEPHLFRGYES